jgi:CBS domain-containing protein
VQTLRDTKLIPASVAVSATFLEAALALCEAGVSAVAVVDEQQKVTGLFTEDDLVAGIFPRYLKELRHTAFTEDIQDALARRAREASTETVAQHLRAPVTLEIDTSATHAAEKFLHTQWGAVAVVDQGRFVGMLTQIDLARWMIERLGLRAD